MQPGNPLSQLVIDYWYKAMLVFCSVLFILALTVDIKVIGNLALLELALGGVFISIGEWINHPLQAAFMKPAIAPEHLFTARNRDRMPSRLGFLFDLLGCILLFMGGFQVFRFMS